MNKIVTYLRNIEHRQNLCGYFFVAVYTLSAIFNFLLYYGIMPETSGWHVFILGSIATIGFALLFTLASNVTSNIFAAGQIVIELYFSFVLPFVINKGEADPYEYAPVYMMCIGFCLLSVLLWGMLMHRNAFDRSAMRWIVFLPLSYLLNIAVYWAAVSPTFDIHPLFEGWNNAIGYLRPTKTLLAPAMIIGYWRLSHSMWFAGNESDLGYPSLSPFNRFTAAYLVAFIAIILLF